MQQEREMQPGEITASWLRPFCLPLIEFLVCTIWTPQVHVELPDGMIDKLKKSPTQSAYLWERGYRFTGHILINTEGELIHLQATLGSPEGPELKPLNFAKLIS